MRDPFSRTKPRMKVRAQSGEAEIFLYDEIGFFGVSAQDFVRELRGIESDTVHLRINSPGGSVFDGVAMANAIREFDGRVIAHVDGMAASIASVIAVSADEVVMGQGTFMMIHDPWTITIGTANELRRDADMLDKVESSIVQAYVRKTQDLSEDDIMSAMEAETWYTADEAVDAGLADSVAEDVERVENDFDLTIFSKVPDELRGSEKPTRRQMERALRDAGCSKKEARDIVSSGTGARRDADEPESRRDAVDEWKPGETPLSQEFRELAALAEMRH